MMTEIGILQQLGWSLEGRHFTRPRNAASPRWFPPTAIQMKVKSKFGRPFVAGSEYPLAYCLYQRLFESSRPLSPSLHSRIGHGGMGYDLPLAADFLDHHEVIALSNMVGEVFVIHPRVIHNISGALRA